MLFQAFSNEKRFKCDARWDAKNRIFISVGYRSAFTILLTVMFLDLLSGMEFDLFVPSLPEIQHFFHLTAFWAEALLAINFIGYCVSLFVFGKYEY